VDATLLLKRMVFRGQGQMPPLAAKLVDDQGVALVRAFLSTLHGPDAGLDSPDGGGADAGSDAGSGGG
jgi:mono/diheme cytochrome c family protein